MFDVERTVGEFDSWISTPPKDDRVLSQPTTEERQLAIEEQRKEEELKDHVWALLDRAHEIETQVQDAWMQLKAMGKDIDSEIIRSPRDAIQAAFEDISYSLKPIEYEIYKDVVISEKHTSFDVLQELMEERESLCDEKMSEIRSHLQDVRDHIPDIQDEQAILEQKIQNDAAQEKQAQWQDISGQAQDFLKNTDEFRQTIFKTWDQLTENGRDVDSVFMRKFWKHAFKTLQVSLELSSQVRAEHLNLFFAYQSPRPADEYPSLASLDVLMKGAITKRKEIAEIQNDLEKIKLNAHVREDEGENPYLSARERMDRFMSGKEAA